MLKKLAFFSLVILVCNFVHAQTCSTVQGCKIAMSNFADPATLIRDPTTHIENRLRRAAEMGKVSSAMSGQAPKGQQISSSRQDLSPNIGSAHEPRYGATEPSSPAAVKGILSKGVLAHRMPLSSRSTPTYNAPATSAMSRSADLYTSPYSAAADIYRSPYGDE